MNRETLRMLPEGVILVNAARGAVVDEEALLEALKSGFAGDEPPDQLV